MGYNIPMTSKTIGDKEIDYVYAPYSSITESELRIRGYYASLSFGVNCYESKIGLTITWFQAFKTDHIYYDHYWNDYIDDRYYNYDYIGFAIGLSYSYRFSFR